MKNINKDIENNTIKQFYLFYGEEDYLKKQYRDKLTGALVDSGDNMNINYFDGKKLKPQEVCDIGETLPFFADCRVIVIENSGWFKDPPEDIEKKLANFPETTHVIFLEREIDKRCKIYKWLDKSGYAVKMDTPDDKMLIPWINGLCKNEGKAIEEQAVYYFVEHMGSDMLLMKNELEKLFSYASDKSVITVDDIREMCVSQAEEKIFEMLDAIGNHNRDKALLLYRDLLVLREPAMRILSMITRHYRILMHIKGMTNEKLDSSEMNTVLKDTWRLQPFAVKKYSAQAKNYQYEELKSMVEQCHDTDHKIKTGNVQDVVGVELLIVEFSSK